MVIPESDILCATLRWLRERYIKIYQLSLPRGKGINYDLVFQQTCLEVIKSIGGVQEKLPNRLNQGPDICGISEKEWWQIECKGAGEGKSQTQRNNFERALASVVSYYEEKPKNLPKEYQQHIVAKPYLGLALPASQMYLNELKRRVRQQLRRTLNLWILLYELESKSIKALSPEDDYLDFNIRKTGYEK